MVTKPDDSEYTRVQSLILAKIHMVTKQQAEENSV